MANWVPAEMKTLKSTSGRSNVTVPEERVASRRCMPKTRTKSSSSESARAEVADANAHLRSLGEPESASFERYLCCFRCGRDSANFEPAHDTGGPSGVTVQGVVVER